MWWTIIITIIMIMIIFSSQLMLYIMKYFRFYFRSFFYFTSFDFFFYFFFFWISGQNPFTPRWSWIWKRVASKSKYLTIYTSIIIIVVQWKLIACSEVPLFVGIYFFFELHGMNLIIHNFTLILYWNLEFDIFFFLNESDILNALFVM